MDKSHFMFELIQQQPSQCFISAIHWNYEVI